MPTNTHPPSILVKLWPSYSPVGILLVAVLIVYLARIYVKTYACESGFLNCGMDSLGVVLPFYLAVISFIDQLDQINYSVLFGASLLVYSYIVYQIGWAIEKVAHSIVRRV